MEISELRQEIDALDREILDRLSRRAELALRAGEIKTSLGVPVYDPIREEELLSDLVRQSQGPLPKHAVRHLFGEIVSACRSLEKSVRVNCQGDREAIAFRSAAETFGTFVQLHSGDSPELVVSSLLSGRYDYGMLIPFQDASTPYWPSLIALGESPLSLLCEKLTPGGRTFLIGRELPELRDDDAVGAFARGIHTGELSNLLAEHQIVLAWQQADVLWLETSQRAWLRLEPAIRLHFPHVEARLVGRLRHAAIDHP